jgi:DNA-nicking Smr family endonuclease
VTRGGGLSPADAALWARVVEAVEPLGGRPPPAAATAAPAEPAPAAVHLPRPRPAAAPPPAPGAIEPRLARRLARGVAAIEGRLDLHGLTQAEAHRRLRAFLLAAQGREARVVLVVTGKGRQDPDADPLASRRGVLRRLVPLWLGDPALRPVVIGFGEAAPAHGGTGALYVRIRRRRAIPP